MDCVISEQLLGDLSGPVFKGKCPCDCQHWFFGRSGWLLWVSYSRYKLGQGSFHDRQGLEVNLVELIWGVIKAAYELARWFVDFRGNVLSVSVYLNWQAISSIESLSVNHLIFTIFDQVTLSQKFPLFPQHPKVLNNSKSTSTLCLMFTLSLFAGLQSLVRAMSSSVGQTEH